MNDHLDIDHKYYNNLDIEGFSQMMKDPSFCYKFYWLEAIVKLIVANVTETTFDAIIDEMISNAFSSIVVNRRPLPACPSRMGRMI